MAILKVTAARRTAVAGIALLAVGACFRDPVTVRIDQTRTQVNAIFQAGDDSAFVLIARANPEVAWPEPVTGADVAIMLNGTEVVLLEPAATTSQRCLHTGPMLEPTAAGCYVADLPVQVTPADVLSFSAALPDGRQVSGEVVVPEPPVVAQPVPGARIPLTCREPGAFCEPASGDQVGAVRVVWVTAIGAGAVEPGFSTTAVFHQGQVEPGTRCRVALRSGAVPVTPVRDSVQVIVKDVSCFGDVEYVPWDSVHVDLWVTAYDLQFAAYLASLDLEEGTIHQRPASAGLIGADGFFAAAASTRIPLTLVRSAAP